MDGTTDKIARESFLDEGAGLEFGAYSSPPCFMHEFDEAAREGPAPGRAAARDAPSWPEVRRWRKETRIRLLARRMAVDPEDRRRWSEQIGRDLEATLEWAGARSIGCYWPIKGEFDARPVLESLHAHGRLLALPVVVEMGRPLAFRAWFPGMKMARGGWNIPIPAEDQPVEPDVLVVPLVGFDGDKYRLGYGGGFYDRTIASRRDRPFLIGVGFSLARLETIYPQDHDIPMDVILSDR